MSEPLFQIGDDVLLASPSGRYSGPTTIEGCRWVKIDCSVCKATSHFIYQTGILGPSGTREWVECVLYKLLPPEQEFDTFIKKLSLDKVKDKVPA